MYFFVFEEGIKTELDYLDKGDELHVQIDDRVCKT